MALHSNIILVGFMGSGKTSTGKDLANILNYDFIDMDHFIEGECGMKIPQIFKECGEKYFREKEKEAIKLLKSKKKHVISTGGGVWLDEENRQQLLKMGLCVWLKVSAEKANKRLESHLSQRPLIASSDNSLETITKLIIEREVEYSKAHIMIDTNNKNSKQVAYEIFSVLKQD